MNCPACGSENTISNGSVRGKKKRACKECNHQFTPDATKKYIDEQTTEEVKRLLNERISLRGIARVKGFSRSWLQGFVNQLYAETPRQVVVIPKKKGRLRIQADELWSFVFSKEQQVWVWMAIDEVTGESVGVAVGDRSQETAQRLWDSLPPVYRQCAFTHTDFLLSYLCVFPSKRHHAVGKETGKTYKIERFWCTLRQRVSRFVRKSLSFSKSLENHIGAIWFFVHHYNASLAVA
jgi:IS1 family transposase/transposase-like protein